MQLEAYNSTSLRAVILVIALSVVGCAGSPYQLRKMSAAELQSSTSDEDLCFAQVYSREQTPRITNEVDRRKVDCVLALANRLELSWVNNIDLQNFESTKKIVGANYFLQITGLNNFDKRFQNKGGSHCIKYPGYKMYYGAPYFINKVKSLISDLNTTTRDGRITIEINDLDAYTLYYTSSYPGSLTGHVSITIKAKFHFLGEEPIIVLADNQEVGARHVAWGCGDPFEAIKQTLKPTIDGSLLKLKQNIRKNNRVLAWAKGIYLPEFHASEIRRIQYSLKKLGYYDGPIDGRFNPEMSGAIEDFQKDNSIAQTGKISRELVGLLEDAKEKQIAVKPQPRKVKPPKIAKSVPKKSEREMEPPTQFSSGSGFFVSRLGHVVTNEHVVHGCKRVTVGSRANKQVPVEVISTDKGNDLALLKLLSLDKASTASKSLIQRLGIKLVPLAANGLLRLEDVKLGEKILVAGFPFGDYYSDTIKVTSGIVSAIRGAGDNSAQFQLDAAVQSGNSGGPIYDSGGNIVGVVVSQLNKMKIAKAIGRIPENVNFGIKASTVKTFLNSSGVPSKTAERTAERSTVELAEIAQKQTLMVMCLQ